LCAGIWIGSRLTLAKFCGDITQMRHDEGQFESGRLGHFVLIEGWPIATGSWRHVMDIVATQRRIGG